MVEDEEAEPEGPAEPDKGGASFRSRAAPAAGVLLLALITAIAAGAGTYIVNHESHTSDHADEAQATARVFLPEYVKARDGLMAMKKRGRAYVYHFDTSIPMPDLKVLAFSGSTARSARSPPPRPSCARCGHRAQPRRPTARRCNGAGSAARR